MNDLTPKQRIFEMLRYLEQLIDAGSSLDDHRYEFSRNIKNCLSWEGQVVDRADLMSE